MKQVLVSGIAVIVCAQGAVATPTPGVSFSLLGDLPGGSFYSSATAISGDGTTVVGHSHSSNGFEAFVWRTGTGMVGIGDLPGGAFDSLAQSVSYDGSVVVGIGRTVIEPPFQTGRGFRWTASEGMIDLGNLNNSASGFSNAHGVSANGQFIAGTAQNTSGFDMFRWDETNGMMSLGGFEGTGVSDDGSVVVGYDAIGGGAFEAQRWTLETGPVGLGFLSGAAGDSRANAVSPNGRFIIGSSSSAAAGAGSREAFRWTESGGMVGLGSTDPESGSFFTEALAMNMDGSVIVGFEQVVGDDEFFATIWTQGVGMQRLDSVLAGMGADLFGFTLLRATGISADGLTIVGVAEDREGFRQAFIATIPTPMNAMWLFGAAYSARRRRR
ncbi:MAG: hypothetical protein KDA16_04210 [Phycisphaerales bacterium]|nr:hypothetical protein [Phycisphaerales bacterium]